MKKRFLIAIACVIASILALCKIYVPDSNITAEIGKVENSIIEEICIENESTTEILEGTIQDEEKLEVQEVENESFELQGKIAYNGDKSNKWNLKVGNTPQLTYISQIDSRWRYYPYTSIGNTSQTIGSSGCGVASAAMIIDSIAGNVDVKELADTFVKNGYRSANSGTYWSAYRAIADEFDIEYTETSNINVMLELLRNNNYIIASCGNGLFTSGGHYIVLYGIEGDTIKVYDPYLYSGKFETSTRRGKVTVSGNTVYCSVDNFKKYANYKQFFCYKYNPNAVDTTNSTDEKVTTSTYTRYVKVNTSLNVRNAPNGNKIGSLYNNNKVTVYETNGIWSRIGNNRWVSSSYLSSSASQTSQNLNSYTTGTYKVNCSKLNVRTGPGANYRKKSLKELTKSARNQGGYVRNVRCSVSKINGNWGKTPSGWICLDYCKKQ